MDGIVKAFAKAFQNVSPDAVGIAQQADATTQSISRNKVVSTDPPYYDNIGYADLSDFFYVWMRRSLKHVYPSLFSTVLVPKGGRVGRDAIPAREQRCCGSIFPVGHDTIASCCRRARRIVGFPSRCTMRSSKPRLAAWVFLRRVGRRSWTRVLRAGLTLSGTWPMRTENDSRLRGQVSNALASSIVLVCRPRPPGAPTTTRKEFLAALRRELPPALRHLKQGNIAPVDLAQASIGPGMAIFSRYSQDPGDGW